MISCIRTNADNTQFQNLVTSLDEFLRVIDGEDHVFYAQFNKSSNLKYVVVAYVDDLPVGCGAIKEYDQDTAEIKRMYVLPERRGQGIATAVLKSLEAWAGELGYHKCQLETGEKQPAAIALYRKNGYVRIENFGQYIGVANSVCFEKIL